MEAVNSSLELSREGQGLSQRPLWTHKQQEVVQLTNTHKAKDGALPRVGT